MRRRFSKAEKIEIIDITDHRTGLCGVWESVIMRLQPIYIYSILLAQVLVDE